MLLYLFVCCCSWLLALIVLHYWPLRLLVANGRHCRRRREQHHTTTTTPRTHTHTQTSRRCGVCVAHGRETWRRWRARRPNSRPPRTVTASARKRSTSQPIVIIAAICYGAPYSRASYVKVRSHLTMTKRQTDRRSTTDMETFSKRRESRGRRRYYHEKKRSPIPPISFCPPSFCALSPIYIYIYIIQVLLQRVFQIGHTVSGEWGDARKTGAITSPAACIFERFQNNIYIHAVVLSLYFAPLLYQPAKKIKTLLKKWNTLLFNSLHS